MKLSSCQISLLKNLLSSTSFVPVHALAKNLEVSAFIIRSELGGLESFCDSFGLELFKYPGRGVMAYGSRRCKVNCLFALNQVSQARIYSKQESQILLLCSLAKTRDFIKRSYFAHILNVSTTTVTNILKETIPLPKGIWLESHKGVGLRLQGELFALVAYISSFVSPHLRPFIYWLETANPSFVGGKGFNTALIQLLEFDTRALAFAESALRSWGFQQLEDPEDWSLALVFVHLFFLFKHKGEGRNISSSLIYKYRALCEYLHLPFISKYRQQADSFYQWASTLAQQILITTPKIQQKIGRSLAKMLYLERLSLMKSLSPLETIELENFFTVTEEEMLQSWRAISTKLQLCEQHVLRLLFEYAYFHNSGQRIFKALVLLPVRDKAVEILLSQYIASLSHCLITPYFLSGSASSQNLEQRYHFALAIGTPAEVELSIPIYSFEPWVIDPSQSILARKELRNALQHFIHINRLQGESYEPNQTPGTPLQ